MTEEDLRIECLRLEILDKSTIQKQLLEYTGVLTTSTPVGQRGDAMDNPAVSSDLAGAGPGVFNPDLFETLYSPVHGEIQSTSQITNRTHTPQIRFRE